MLAISITISKTSQQHIKREEREVCFRCQVGHAQVQSGSLIGRMTGSCPERTSGPALTPRKQSEVNQCRPLPLGREPRRSEQFVLLRGQRWPSNSLAQFVCFSNLSSEAWTRRASPPETGQGPMTADRGGVGGHCRRGHPRHGWTPGLFGRSSVPGLRTWARNPLLGAEQVFLGREQFTFLISKVANWLGCQPTSKNPTEPKGPWSSAAGGRGAGLMTKQALGAC